MFALNFARACLWLLLLGCGFGAYWTIHQGYPFSEQLLWCALCGMFLAWPLWEIAGGQTFGERVWGSGVGKLGSVLFIAGLLVVLGVLLFTDPVDYARFEQGGAG